MASLFDFSSTAGSNGTIDGTNIAEGCNASGLNNAIRSLMAIIRQSFSATLQNFLSGASALGISSGGTGATTAANARAALSVAKSGANSDITALTGLTTALAAAYGGTGQSSAIFTLTGNATAGTLAMSVNGSTVFKVTWKDATVGANSTASHTYHTAFSSWSRAWFNGGTLDVGADENGPFAYSETTGGCALFNARNVSVSGTVFAIGV